MGTIDRKLAETLRRALGNPAGVRQGVIADLLEGTDATVPDGRSSGRLGVRLPAAVWPREHPEKRLHAQVTDVGLSGLAVKVGGRLPDFEPVMVELCLPPPGPCRFFGGRVTWSRADLLPARLGVGLDAEDSYAWFAALREIAAAARAQIPLPASVP
jgi:hypothetical protein